MVKHQLKFCMNKNKQIAVIKTKIFFLIIFNNSSNIIHEYK